MFFENKFHLSYCTNIHPGADWDTTFQSLQDNIPKVKERVNHHGSFGIGLRLSNQASLELSQGSNLMGFKSWLQETDCYVFTMNGFPYGNFHGEAVKDRVHLPDWSSPERLDYTSRLFHQLTEMLNEGQEGGISTSPVSYKPWFHTESAKNQVFEKAALQMAELAYTLHVLEGQTGCYLHLDIEPEPDGFLENSEEFITFYKEYLLVVGAQWLFKERGIKMESAEEILVRHISMCYDICHFSLAYEEPEYSFSTLESAGINIGKIQISAALKILANKDVEKLYESLVQFDEPTYLHQVTQAREGQIYTYSDLPLLLSQRPKFEELRAHFHVPIFMEAYESLFSTQDHITKVLSYIQNHKVTNHLEVETYTWEVLPGGLKMDIADSIARELNWVLDKMNL